DEPLVAVMERLVTAEKQRRWSLWVERWQEPGANLLRPEIWRSLRSHAQIVVRRRLEHRVGVGKPALFDAVGPDNESIAERRPCCLGRTDEVGDRVGPGLDHAVAQPPHAPRMLDPILMREAEILAEVGAHGVGIKVDAVEARH